MNTASPASIEDDLEEARRIIASVLGKGRARVFLIGSRAWGTPSARADVDIGILPEEPLAPGTLAALRDAFEESHIPFRVDVVDLSRVDPALRDKAVRQGIAWSA